MFNTIKEIENAVNAGKKVYWKSVQYKLISYTNNQNETYIIIKDTKTDSTAFKLINSNLQCLNGEIWEYFSEDDIKYIKANNQHLSDLQYPMLIEEINFLRNEWLKVMNIPKNITHKIPLSYIEREQNVSN